MLCDSTSVGFCTAWMTLAIVNVLPEPVTPISTCCLRPARMPVDQRLDRLRLIAGRLERTFELKSHNESYLACRAACSVALDRSTMAAKWFNISILLTARQ